MKDVELPDDYEPGGDKDFMGPRHRLYFRQRLVGWRDEIIRDAQDTIHHLQESEGAEPDMADRAFRPR